MSDDDGRALLEFTSDEGQRLFAAVPEGDADLERLSRVLAPHIVRVQRVEQPQDDPDVLGPCHACGFVLRRSGISRSFRETAVEVFSPDGALRYCAPCWKQAARGTRRDRMGRGAKENE